MLEREVAIRNQERVERDFVTNAAHELQSPLASIISAIEVLQAGAKDGPERDIFLEHIEHASGRLDRLVRSMLVLARAQSGIERPRDDLIALAPVLEEIAATLNVAPGVEVRVSCPPDTAVVSNRELVEQALINLAENAAKHTVEGVIDLSARASETATVVVVSDTGPGIPAPERPHVFERFYRGSGQGVGGFGLGLAIVHAAATSLGAQLELESAPGEGTVVRLRFPGTATLVSE
jgi:two-component system, OmpR family, sensor histidine kinase TctE